MGDKKAISSLTLMNFEANRMKSFKDWPFKEDCSCTPQAMAKAGFYHCPSDVEPDLAKCFVCLKELDGWEPTDDPWQEHVSHAQNCPFVLLNKEEKDQTLEEFIRLEANREMIIIQKKVEERLKQFQAEATEVRSHLAKVFK